MRGSLIATLRMKMKIRHFAAQDQVRRYAVAYITLVEHYMSYCCIVWTDVDKTLCLDRIHKIQKRYCRLIAFSESRAHSAPLFNKLKVLNIYITCSDFKLHLIYMYKHINGLLPRTFLNFQLNSNVHSHFTRQSKNLHNIFFQNTL